MTRTSDARGWSLAIVAWALVMSGACGREPARLGELVNTAGVSKSDAGVAPADIVRRGFASPTALMRTAYGDVLGDEAPETVVPLPEGAGVDVRDARGALLVSVETEGHLTALGLVPASRAPKRDLVLYLYPDPPGGGAFEVRTPDNALVARWTESPPPSHFAVGAWRGDPAILYLQGDVLVVRSPVGAPVARLEAPEGGLFSDLFVETVAGRLVVVASGDGYVPFHTVLVYAPDGQRVYQDVAGEQAFAVEPLPDLGGVAVSARSRVWHYRLPDGP